MTRRLFDALSLLAAVAAFLGAMYWAHANADPGFGSMWRQVLATAVGYGVFLAVLAAAFFLRRHSWR